MSALSRAGAISPIPEDTIFVDDKIFDEHMPYEFLRQGALPNCTFLLPPLREPLPEAEVFRRTFNALDIAKVPTERKTSTAVRFYRTVTIIFHRTPSDPDEEDDVTGTLEFQHHDRLEFHHKILPDLTAREQVDKLLGDNLGESIDTVAEKASAVAIKAVEHACSEPTPADVGASFWVGAPVISGVPRCVSWGLGVALATALSPAAGVLTLGVASVISYTTAEENPSSPPPEAQ